MSKSQNHQISLPPTIYTFFNFFNKSKQSNWKKNPFKIHKIINGIEIKLAKNISNLNLYQIDLPIDKKIKPDFLIKYIKNKDYRNYYSKETLFYELISIVDDHKWFENEIYNQSKNKFTVIESNFLILFYNETVDFTQNISDTKYYNSYKILSTETTYILRFETVLNNMDIDQDIDIIIYINMLIRLLKAVHDKFKLTFDILPIKKLEEYKSIDSSKNNSPKNSVTTLAPTIYNIVTTADKSTQTE